MDQAIHQQLEELRALEETEAKKLALLQSEIEQISQALSRDENALIQLNRQKRKVMAQNFNMQVQIDELDTEYENLVQKFDDLKNQLSEIQIVKKKAVQEAVSNLRKELQKQREEHHIYTQRIKDYFDNQSEFGKKQKQLSRLLQEKQATTQSLCCQLEQQTQLNLKMNKTIQELQRDKHSIIQLKRKLEQNTSKTISDLREQIKQMKETIGHKTRETTLLHSELNQQKDLLKTIEEQIAEQENKKSMVNQLKNRVFLEHQQKQNQLKSIRQQQ